MEGEHKCPVCGQYEFKAYDSFEVCAICGWEDDSLQENNPNYAGGANNLSLNQARAAFKNGDEVF